MWRENRSGVPLKGFIWFALGLVSVCFFGSSTCILVALNACYFSNRLATSEISRGVLRVEHIDDLSVEQPAVQRVLK